jgi:hypothetical protein
MASLDKWKRRQRDVVRLLNRKQTSGTEPKRNHEIKERHVHQVTAGLDGAFVGPNVYGDQRTK